MLDKHKTFCDEINCDGVSYRFISSHLLNSKKLITQLIDSKTGIDVPLSNYTLIRKNMNNIIIEFKDPPFKGEQYYLLVLKVD